MVTSYAVRYKNIAVSTQIEFYSRTGSLVDPWKRIVFLYCLYERGHTLGHTNKHIGGWWYFDRFYWMRIGSHQRRPNKYTIWSKSNIAVYIIYFLRRLTLLGLFLVVTTICNLTHNLYMLNSLINKLQTKFNFKFSTQTRATLCVRCVFCLPWIDQNFSDKISM